MSGKLISLVSLLQGWHGQKAMLPPCGGSGLRAACRPCQGPLPGAGLNFSTSLPPGREAFVLDIPDKPNKSLRKVLGKLIPFGSFLEEEI